MPNPFLSAVAAGLLLLSTLAAPVPAAEPVNLNESVAIGQTYQGIRLLGALRLPTAVIDGYPLGGLSGLTWDRTRERLYALSDQGILFHLRPIFEQDRLVEVQVLEAHPLRDARGQVLKEGWSDAEDLVLVEGKQGPELLVVFEIRHRLVRYDTTGRWLGDSELPARLRDGRYYSNPNTALEALALYPGLGLVVGAERPLWGMPRSTVPIVARDGRFWHYPLAAAPRSSLVAMAALADGQLLTLERAFVSLVQPLVITLRLTRLDVPPGQRLPVTELARLSTGEGWTLDNFEGLTLHQGQRFFMISDDNFNPLQGTLLVYFELAAVRISRP